MSNDFNIQVKVDPGSSTASIKQVETALAQTEIKMTATERAAVAVGKAFASLGTRASQEMAQGMASGMRAFDGMTAAIKREADILERIRGPMREYTADQMALESMFKRNILSAKEYTTEVERLNNQIDKAPKKHGEGEGERGAAVEGSFKSAIAGQFGEAGNVASGLAGGALEAAGVVALGVEIIHLGDEYTALSNKAVRFADAGHDVNTILNDQMTLSKEIHGGLEQTVELYSAIREGTDDLNYSYRDQITVTKSLAEEVQLSGKSLEQSGGLMQRLSFAFESGTINGRELKGMMREFPALGETLRDSFGKSSAQLIAMANKGQLAPQMILDALIQKAPEIEEKFGKIAETSAMKWQHFKDDVTTAVGGAFDWQGLKEKARELEDPIGVATEKIDELTGKLREMSSPIWRIQIVTRGIEDKVRKDTTYQSLSDKANADLVEQMKAAAKARKDAIYDREVMKAEADSKAVKPLTDEQKLLQEIIGPAEEAEKKLALLDVLYGKSAISLAAYNEQVWRFKTILGSAELKQQTNFGMIQPMTDVPAPLETPAEQDPKLLTKNWEADIKSYEENFKETNKRIAETFKPIEDAIVQLVTKGKIEWSSMVDSMLGDLTHKLIGQGESALAGVFTKSSNLSGISTSDASMASLTSGASSAAASTSALAAAASSAAAALSGFAGAGAAGAVGSAGSAVSGSQASAFGVGFGPQLGNASESAWNVVSGAGGGLEDNWLGDILRRAPSGGDSPFAPASGNMQDATSSVPAAVHVHNHFDPSAIHSAINTPEGERHIVNIIRRNAPALRNMLGGGGR